MKKKTTYHLRNWKQYNAALRQRGSLTVWFSDEALQQWTTKEKTGGRGASPTYSQQAIETMATLQAIYHLAGRQTQGLLQSLFQLLKLSLPVPDHSTLARRRGRLNVALPVRRSSTPRHLVIDATGVKVYGEGEWKVRQHGVGKRRTWRKLHLCVDATTQELVAVGASTANVTDAALLPVLLSDLGTEAVAQVSADGAYDQRACYAAIQECRARAVIPPRQGARIWQHGNTKAARHARDENLRRMRQVGKKKWKEESGYHRRSLAETSVFRFKAIFGARLSTRQIENQLQELFLKCAILNRMTHLGMPNSERCAG